MRCAILVIVWGGLLCHPGAGMSQQVTALLARSPGTTLRAHHALGYRTPVAAPVAVTLSAVHLGAPRGDRWGAGMDLVIGAANRPLYGMLGVSAGWGAGQLEGTWGGWSAGLGYVALRVGGLELAAEGRMLRLSNPGDAGVLGVRVALPVRAGGTPSAVVARSMVPMTRSAATQAIIDAARDAMGTPYAWGGTDANGFDCSGLIQYAFRRGGVGLPRTSQAQAATGVPVSRDPAALEPGDILTFAEDGRLVSHVGLYLGGGEFIHSASRGVRISRLTPDDPDGGYWWRRWMGARRLLVP